jgi:hypothetical protein
MRDLRAQLTWALQLLLAKRSVTRVVPDFTVDLDGRPTADFEDVVPSLLEVERRLLEVPADRQGMRWIHELDLVLFHAERTFDVPFEEFVERVDIGHVGQFYRDALGVTTRVVDRDAQGRTRHQGVHVIALPQPNYAALMGKEELDVYKLETIERDVDRQRVWMVTVHSPNGSAVRDDGAMTFRRSPDGTGTVAAFLAAQSFPVPPLMRALRVDRWRWFMTVVTESAYRRFCSAMWRNIADCQRGRAFAVGRPVPVAAAVPA